MLPMPADGTVLVRLGVHDRDWARWLPPVPDDRMVTVTVAQPELVPPPDDSLVEHGYRIVGVAPEGRGPRATVDVLVPPDLREEHQDWWRALLAHAERVFDLRLGPVQKVLAPEIDLHLTGAP